MDLKQCDVLDRYLTAIRQEQNERDTDQILSTFVIGWQALDKGHKKDVIDALKEIPINDGYLISDNYGRRLTGKGILFNENEGYVKRATKEAAEEKRLRDIQSNAEVSAQNIFFLTVVIALGTFVMAIYSVIQIWKFYMCYYYELFCV